MLRARRPSRGRVVGGKKLIESLETRRMLAAQIVGSSTVYATIQAAVDAAQDKKATGVVVLEALARVNAEMGTTTVVITHNAAIASMADRVVRLADGRVTAVEDRTERKLSPRELSW